MSSDRSKPEPDINLFRAIEVFMAVAEMRQVTAAANALKITQSAASHHLRNLETIFGVPLLDRSVRPIALTYAGETMQRHGYRLLNLIDDLRRDMNHLSAASLPARIMPSAKPAWLEAGPGRNWHNATRSA